MVVNKSCVAACQKSVRMTVESVSGCSWNECPDQRGITVRMRVEWVSESAWNPQQYREWGTDGFAQRYTRNFQSVEGPAYEMGERVRKALREQK